MRPSFSSWTGSSRSYFRGLGRDPGGGPSKSSPSWALSLPFFLVEALWPWLQVEGGIPRGLNVQAVPVMAWNLWFAFRWFTFPVHETPQGVGEPSPQRVSTGGELNVTKGIRVFSGAGYRYTYGINLDRGLSDHNTRGLVLDVGLRYGEF